MSRSDQNEHKNEVRVELKYCERCGGLFMRETGVAAVYCAKCELKIADLPIPKKRPGRVILPAQTKLAIRKHVAGEEDESKTFQAAGGVA